MFFPTYIRKYCEELLPSKRLMFRKGQWRKEKGSREGAEGGTDPRRDDHPQRAGRQGGLELDQKKKVYISILDP